VADPCLVAICDLETIHASALKNADPHTAFHDLQAGRRRVKELARNEDGRYEPSALLFPGDTNVWWSQAQPVLVAGPELVKGADLFTWPGRYRFKICNRH
jgi:hypothetical protein